MSSMTTSAAATRVATAARVTNSAKGSSVRAVSTASMGKRSAAAGRSAQFFQGDRAASVELRQRQVSTQASHRAVSKRAVTASATPVPAVQAAAPAEWKGAKLKPLGYSVLAGLIIWLIPAPAGVTAQAWHLLAVFVGTIVGIITNVSRHYPVPASPAKSRTLQSQNSLTTSLPLLIAASSPRRHRHDRSRRLDGHWPSSLRRCLQRLLL